MGKAKKGTEPTGQRLGQALFELLTQHPGLKTSDIQDRTGVHQLDVRDELVAWEKQGISYREGRTRGTRWYLKPGAAAPEELPPEAGAATPRRRVVRPVKAEPVEAPARKAKAAPAEVAPSETRARPKATLLEANRHLFGTMTDGDVAKKTGVSMRTVAKFRADNHIPAFTSSGRPVKAAAPAAPAAVEPTPAVVEPKPAPPVAPKKVAVAAEAKKASAPRSAWRIEFRSAGASSVRFAFAGSVAEAADVASSAAVRMQAEVVGLTWVGDALD